MKKDIGLKIATKDEAYWTEIKESTEKDIERLRKVLKFQEAVLEMVKIKIDLAKHKGR